MQLEQSGVDGRVVVLEHHRGPGAGARMQFTMEVADVDAMCEELVSRGAELLNGPMDTPWGIRTASFRDPGGHIWELAQ
ncbi:MAG TPA: VOC family protein [Gaiellaceae bacterium]